MPTLQILFYGIIYVFMLINLQNIIISIIGFNEVFAVDGCGYLYAHKKIVLGLELLFKYQINYNHKKNN